MELVKTVKNLVEKFKPKEYTLVVNSVRRDEQNKAHFHINVTINNKNIEEIFRMYNPNLAGELALRTGLVEGIEDLNIIGKELTYITINPNRLGLKPFFNAIRGYKYGY